MASVTTKGSSSSSLRLRDLGYAPGIHTPGPSNSILDVPGVHVSQVTVPTSDSLPNGSTAVKGVTIISPRPPQEFYKPCPAATFVFNGNGELTGVNQIADWGFTNMPLAFTNSLSLGTVFDGIWDWVIDQQDAFKWDKMTRARHYGTPVVGETSDWLVNSDVRASRLSREDISKALNGLKGIENGGKVLEGQFGGGAGMTCHHHAGGTGTASRKVGGGEGSEREYTLGVLVQTNYGHLTDLTVAGVPVGKLILKERGSNFARFKAEDQGADVHAPDPQIAGRTDAGSLLILIITDAPLATHQLNRLARHATVGLTQVGSYGVGRTHSGDIFIALSTAEQGGGEQLENTTMRHMNPSQSYARQALKNESIDPYFYACAEAVEEAILNSIVGGRPGVVGTDGTTKVDGFPVDLVKEMLEKYMVKV